MSRWVRFLPKGFEGESEARRGYGVYGVLLGVEYDAEATGVWGKET